MTLPLFLLDPARVAGLGVGSAVRLEGPEGRHAATVRRMTTGERLFLADGSGLRLEAEIVTAGRDTLDLTIRDVTRDPEPSPRLVLVQALAKGDRDDQAIEAATELGVDEVIPWQAARSIVQWRGERVEKSRRKWENTVLSAAKQSRRSRVPVVAGPVTTVALAARLEDRTAYVLHENATETLAGQSIPTDGEVILVVGPEGGITADEVRVLQEAGGRVVRLGDTVLRSSSAGPAAIAVVLARTRWS